MWKCWSKRKMYRAKKVLFLLLLIQERSRKKFTFGALDELFPVEIMQLCSNNV
jgi:hypothetical protein